MSNTDTNTGNPSVIGWAEKLSTPGPASRPFHIVCRTTVGGPPLWECALTPEEYDGLLVREWGLLREDQRAKEMRLAYDLGRRAFVSGFKMRAVPVEYREQGHEAEARAWIDGWEHASKENEDIPF